MFQAILNEDMESNCPEVLYEIKEETSVFPKLRLDPVDNNYIYLSSANKVSPTLKAKSSDELLL